MRKEPSVYSLSHGIKIHIGGRRIQVLLDSGHAMNPVKPIQPKDIPMQDLKNAQEQVEAEERADGLSASSSSRASGSALQSTSSGHVNRRPDGVVDTNILLDDKNDEITESPVEETRLEPDRPGRDIRFEDLPHPRNDIQFCDPPQLRNQKRENSDGTPISKKY